jgi:CRP-like cAMP-binding protein
VLYRPNTSIEHVYFVERGLVSLVKTMQDGRTVEIGVVGINGITGIGGFLGVETAAFESIVQIPGYGRRMPMAILQQEAEKHVGVRVALLKYARFVLSEVAQTAACHRLHSLEERCCRWLLVAHDNAQADTFPLTHEFLAVLLGVGRSYVSAIATALRKAGFIRYLRGRITIIDRSGLEASACECYGSVRTQFHRLFGTQPMQMQNPLA